jgi:hypothetical protein
MTRLAWFALSLAFSLLPPAVLQAQPNASPPVMYDIRINGETFRVEGNRLVKVESKKQPGTSYEIAVRMSLSQPIRLDTIQLDYDLPAKVSYLRIKPTDKAALPLRGVEINHEMGFTVVITDLGGPLDEKGRAEALKILRESTSESIGKGPEAKLTVGEPYDRTFNGAACRGVTLNYQDAKEEGHTCLAYVLTGPKFAATCVVQYPDANEEVVLPVIRKILDSVRVAE